MGSQQLYVFPGPLARVQAVIRTFKDSDVDFAMDAQQLQDLCSITLPLEEWRAEHFVRNLAPTPGQSCANSMSLLLLMATMSDAGPEVGPRYCPYFELKLLHGLLVRRRG
jgi:hypothetical protein